jgi:YD repeat-containing protein
LWPNRISILLLTGGVLPGGCTAADDAGASVVDTADGSPPDAGRPCTVDRRFPGPCAEFVRSPDGAERPVRERAWDAAAHLVLDRRFGPDGTPGDEETWTYDSHGQRTSYVQRSRGRVLVADVCTHVYQGERLVESACDGGPGGPDGTPEVRTTFAYDAEGRVVRAESDGEPPFEAPDGTPDSVVTHRYDAAGREVETAQDTDADGDVDRSTRRTFDETGRPTSVEEDRTGDGRGERRTEWTYDDATGRSTERVDDGGDGTWESERVTTHDADGRVLTETATYLGLDGLPYTVETTHTLRPDGQPERRVTTWSDGSGSTTAYTYDATDRLETTVTESAGPMGSDAEAPPMRHTTTFDCAGNELAFTTDVGRDGTIDDEGRFTYDDACWPR